MKKYWLGSLMVPLICGILKAVPMESSIGGGVVTSDDSNSDSTGVGKADVQWNLGSYFSLGVSAGQTGDFDQRQVSQEVQAAKLNPNGFAVGNNHHHVNDEDFYDDNNDPATVVNILPAVDPKPKRPIDTTARSYWFGEPFIALGLPLKALHLIGTDYLTIRPYAKAFLGASGVKSYDGESRIGVSEGVGGGISLSVSNTWNLSVEALRRGIDTGVNTYGGWQTVGKIGFLF